MSPRLRIEVLKLKATSDLSSVGVVVSVHSCKYCWGGFELSIYLAIILINIKVGL